MSSTRSNPARDLPGKPVPRALGLSMLVAVSMMVMSASAQAQQLLVQSNGFERDPSTLEIIVKLGFLLSDFGNIFCESGTAIAEVTGVGTDLEVNVSAIFTKCDVFGFEKNCDTRSSDQKVGPGTITAKGEGSVTMEGSKTYVLLESNEFTTLIVEGNIFCPYEKVEAPVGGAVGLTLDVPEVEQVTKFVLLDEEELFFEEVETDLEASGGGPVETLVQQNTGLPWAIVLD